MNDRNQVETIRKTMTAEGAAKPEIIRQLAIATLEWPYVFGAWGEDCTPPNRRRRVREDHPTIKSACQVLRDTNRKSDCIGCKWYPNDVGVRMYDCRGYTRWLIQQVGLDITGQGATSQYNTNANWVRKGPIGEMPDCVCCVFQKKDGKMQHTGMHIGGGAIIHCSRNVQTGKTSDRGWTHYAIPVGLYSEEEIPVQTVKRTLRRGSTGDDVRELQDLLNRLGYDCGEADGVYGTKTINAVKRFQQDHGLDADGVCGQKTWAALDQTAPAVPDEDTTKYTVICYGMTWDQSMRIRAVCPTAEMRVEED